MKAYPDLQDHEIWSLIFWMWNRSDRHIHMRPDIAIAIIQTRQLYQRTETLKKKHYLEVRRYRRGIFCPTCYQETKDWYMPRLVSLPMYRKHLVDDSGQVKTIVHMSQCMRCWTIVWSRVGVLSYSLPNLKLSDEKPKRKRKKNANEET